MQIKEKMLNRIVSLLMCILLLSNFGLSITLAVEGSIATVELSYKIEGDIEAGPDTGQRMDVYLYDLKSGGRQKTITIVPRITALYTIQVVDDNTGE